MKWAHSKLQLNNLLWWSIFKLSTLLIIQILFFSPNRGHLPNNNNNFIKVSFFIARHTCRTNWGLRQIKLNHNKSNQMNPICWFLVKGENWITQGKTSKNWVENHQTQSTDDSESGNRNPCHIGGRRVLSPLRQPCFLRSMVSVSNHWLRSNKTYMFQQ